jgi:signal transduction histidine kinase
LKRSAHLVRDFKQLAAGPDSEPAALLDVPSLCEQLLNSESRALAAAGLRVTRELAPHAPLVTRHHALVEVLRALLNNVCIHAKATELTLRGRGEAGGYRIDCVDNGVGIHAQPASRVFEPFFSTRFGQGGSGLGLTVALHRTRALLGGDLTVQSHPGEGCRFQLQLPPLAPGESQAPD